MTNSKGIIDNELIEILNKLSTKKNICFITGRNKWSSILLLQNIQNYLLVCNNGNLIIYDEKNSYNIKFFKDSVVLFIYEELSEYYDFIFETSNEIFVSSRRAYINYKRYYQIEDEIKYIGENFHGNNIHTITLLPRNEDLDFSMLSKISQLDNEIYFRIRKDSGWIHIGIKIDKVEGIKVLCDNLGYSSDNLIYFGDGLNDISAFDFVGKSIAVQNANIWCKKKANIILDIPIKKYLLKILEGDLD